MAIALPPLPRGTTLSPRLISFGGDLRPILGAPTLRLQRLGSRFAIDVEMPKMARACASRLIAARLASEARSETLRLSVTQNGDGAAVGPKFATAGAANSAVITTAGAAGIEPGMFFSFQVGGHSYLHMATSVAGAVVGVAPLLRVNASGVALEFANPVAEGFVDAPAWTLERLLHIAQRFTLTEDC